MKSSRNSRLPGRRLWALCIAACVLVLVIPTWALPAYRRLWVRQYTPSYTSMTCLLCHASYGGSELTPYGQDFQRYGATTAAFKAIERVDSDGDGALNLDEIAVRSNPGDARSTPRNPGSWLQSVEKSALPTGQLEKLFPGVKTFTVLEGALSDKQLQQAESLLGSPLSQEDAVPVFYFANREQDGRLRRIGVALYAKPAAGAEDFTVVVGADLSGRVTRVLLTENRLDQRLDDEGFLGQFIGKSAGDSTLVGADIRTVAGLESASQRVAGAVKKALLIIAEAFSRKPGDD